MTVLQGGPAEQVITPHRENKPDGDPESSPETPAREPAAHSLRNGEPTGSTNPGHADPLERALLLAAEARQWAVVAQLTRELEARRLAGSNVVPMARRQPK